MAVTNRNGLLYDDDQLRRYNASVANQALESLKQSQAKGTLPQMQRVAQTTQQTTAQRAAQAAARPSSQTMAQPAAQQAAQQAAQAAQPQGDGSQNAQGTAQQAQGPTAGINTDYGYKPSQAVIDAYDYLQSVINSKPGEYTSRYTDQLQAMLDQIMNREPFQYDAYADPLFQIYQDQYIQGGRRAMQDTMGQAAALTGGYGNSYAQTVGQQTYNQYMENLMNVIPELSEMAYSRYMDEGDALERNYSMLNQLENQDYSRYRDLVGDWYTERQMAENTYGTERGFDYGAFNDRRQYDQQNEQFARQMALQEAQLQLQREQLAWQRAQATKSSGGRSSSKNSTKDKNTQSAEEIRKNANDFIANLNTKTEYYRHGNTGSYDNYVTGKVQAALNDGKLSNNEAIAVLDYFMQR